MLNLDTTICMYINIINIPIIRMLISWNMAPALISEKLIEYELRHKLTNKIAIFNI